MNRLKLLFSHSQRLLAREPCRVNFAYKFIGRKNLFTHSSLGIDSFKESRENCLRAIPNQQKFKSQMAENCEKTSSYFVFSDDLKKMLKIAESEEDLLTLQKMIIRFNSQANTVRFQAFNFGPEILRLYYVLNKPVEAMALFENKEMFDMFNNIKSYVLLFNLLYENQMYKEIINIYNKFSENLSHNKFSFGLVITFFGACYKLNNAESYNEAVKFLEKLAEADVKCPLKGIWFSSMLALNQNHTYEALELVSNAPLISMGINIKAMVLAKLKRYDDAVFTLHSFLFSKQTRVKSPGFILNDTFTFLENEFKESDEEQLKSLHKMKKNAVDHNFLKFESLDQCLCGKMAYFTHKQFVENMKERSFKRI